MSPAFGSWSVFRCLPKAKLIKDLGNLAVHSKPQNTACDALTATRELFHFCYWLAVPMGKERGLIPSMFFYGTVAQDRCRPAQTQAQLNTLESGYVSVTRSFCITGRQSRA